jgi:Sulfotransferase domain
MAGRADAPAQVAPWFDMSIAVTQKSGFHGTMSQAELIEAFNDEVAAVKNAIAPERLLVFEVKDGWEPLCTFLDQPVPTVPFPRTNNTEEFWDLVRRAIG